MTDSPASTTSPSDLADAMAFLAGHHCHLVEDDRIQLPARLPADQVTRARRLKPVLLELLTEAARDLREERAAILEHEAGFTRTEAEQRAGLEPIPPVDPTDCSGENVARPGIQTRMVPHFTVFSGKCPHADAAHLVGQSWRGSP